MNVHPDLKTAIDMAKSGNKSDAAQLLSRILKEQPENEAAWLWLASCLKTNQQKLYCLNQALALNAENETTRKAILKIKEAQTKPAEEIDPPKSTTTRPKSIVVPTHQSEISAPKKRSWLPAIIIIGIIGIIFVILLLTSTAPQPDPQSIEALYLSNLVTGQQNNSQTYYLLRFYPDGTVMGATVLGTADQVGDMWSVFIFQNRFTLENKENFAYGSYQLGEETPDGKLIAFTLDYKYPGHPDYDQRLYSGYINDKETYLTECTADNMNCTNRYYERINQETETP